MPCTALARSSLDTAGADFPVPYGSGGGANGAVFV